MGENNSVHTINNNHDLSQDAQGRWWEMLSPTQVLTGQQNLNNHKKQQQKKKQNCHGNRKEQHKRRRIRRQQQKTDNNHTNHMDQDVIIILDDNDGSEGEKHTQIQVCLEFIFEKVLIFVYLDICTK